MKLFCVKRDKVIATCLKKDIPLTDNNIKEVIEILKQKREIQLSKQFNKSKYNN